MKDIKISVITPTFNSIQFIEICIQNVILQKCNYVEHIIVDAASTDGTVDIIKQYAEKYPHIRWISEPDKGQSDAMNKGIQMAQADIISFLNVDDLYTSFVLNRVIHIFEQHPNFEFIAGNCRLYDFDGNLLYYNRPQRIKPYHLFSYTEPFPINPAAYFYKKQIHERAGYYTVDNHFTMDYEFILKASMHCNMIYCNEDWGIAIYHEQSKTQNDLQQNKMFERKRNTFDSVYSNIPNKIKLLAQLYSIYKKIKR